MTFSSQWNLGHHLIVTPYFSASSSKREACKVRLYDLLVIHLMNSYFLQSWMQDALRVVPVSHPVWFLGETWSSASWRFQSAPSSCRCAGLNKLFSSSVSVLRERRSAQVSLDRETNRPETCSAELLLFPWSLCNGSCRLGTSCQCPCWSRRRCVTWQYVSWRCRRRSRWNGSCRPPWTPAAGRFVRTVLKLSGCQSTQASKKNWVTDDMTSLKRLTLSSGLVWNVLHCRRV